MKGKRSSLTMVVVVIRIIIFSAFDLGVSFQSDFPAILKLRFMYYICRVDKKTTLGIMNNLYYAYV